MDQKKMAIIATKGTLDWAYPPFILASTAAALGYETQIFFTFYGLQLVRKDLSVLKVSPLGNPGMPMKMPFGPKWFKNINWNMPNAIQAIIPGYENVATALMKQTIANNGVATIPDLREWSTAARPPSSSSLARPTSACLSERSMVIRKKPGRPGFFYACCIQATIFLWSKKMPDAGLQCRFAAG